jgi:hypothetical protein
MLSVIRLSVIMLNVMAPIILVKRAMLLLFAMDSLARGTEREGPIWLNSSLR